LFLVREPLGPALEGAQIKRLKELYLFLHQETKKGTAGAMSKHGSANDNLSFAESTAEASGIDKRTVERAASRGDAIVGLSIDAV
jgi:hypothetical protein